jgi:propionate catabolism operon transcriptional regulator
MKILKILFLTYGKLYNLAEEAIDTLNDPNLDIEIYNGIFDKMLVTKGKESIEMKFDAIIAGGYNATFASRNLDIPVFDISLTSYDYLKTILNAKEISNNIGVTLPTSNKHYPLDEISKFLNIHIEKIFYDSPLELEEKIKISDSQVFIGASLTDEICNTINKKSYLIYPGIDTIINTLLYTKSRIHDMINKTNKSELMMAIIKHSPNGVIAIDNEGKIIEFNQYAEKVFNISKKDIIGSSIEDFNYLPNFKEALSPTFSRVNRIFNIEDKKYLEKQIQLFTKGKIYGAVSLVIEMSEIQSAEYKYQLESKSQLYNKGFKAKYTFENIIGSSNSLLNIINKAKIFTKSDANILILGESGTGKELFAQSIHNHSERKDKPFIAINCAALPENLLESELFGYEDGAFTGSKKGGKMGIFELAKGGTIFLDEIGEISNSLQTKLLRVLQEKEAMRIGGERIYKTNVRIISATHREIYKKDKSLMRQDLMYRLNVLELNIPPLREREDDIYKLFMFFISKKLSFEKRNIVIQKSTLNILIKYSWPGNIRELENSSERFSLFMNNSNRIDENIIKKFLVDSIGEEKILQDIYEKRNITSIENLSSNKEKKDLIMELKEILNISNNQIADKIGISRTTMWRICKD